MNENSDQYINRANQEGHGTVFLAQQMISNLRIMKLDRFSLSTMKDFYFLSGHPSLPKKKVRSFSTLFKLNTELSDWKRVQESTMPDNDG